MKKRFSALLLCFVLLAAAFSGCGGGASGAETIRMDIDGPVENLDPQFATDPTARMILSNLFEGLTVKSPDGSVRLGAAADYQITPDGLTYTFTLREDTRWEDGSPVVAADFVFAFTRLFAPQAPSPFSEEFAVIAGAREVMAGTAPPSALGVTARGTDTVVFTLEQPLADFLSRLAGTAALPCNRAAFERSHGRYGLEARYVHANGPFLLSRWDNARFLQLERNSHFRADASGLFQRVILHIGRDDPVKQFLDGRSDLLRVPSGGQEQLAGRSAELIPGERTIWALVFNQNVSPWNNTLLRQSLALTLDRHLYSEHLPQHLRATPVFIPPAALIDGQSFRASFGEASPLGLDVRAGRRLFARGLDWIEQPALPASNLVFLEAHLPYLELLEMAWAGELGASLTLTAATAEQMSARRSQGDFGLALLPFSLSSQGPGSVLAPFHSAGGRGGFGYQNPRFDHALELAARAESAEEAARHYHLAETILLEDAAVIPLFFETTYYALARGLTGVEIFPYGNQIHFHNARRS